MDDSEKLSCISTNRLSIRATLANALDCFRGLLPNIFRRENSSKKSVNLDKDPNESASSKKLSIESILKEMSAEVVAEKLEKASASNSTVNENILLELKRNLVIKSFHYFNTELSSIESVNRFPLTFLITTVFI